MSASKYSPTVNVDVSKFLKNKAALAKAIGEHGPDLLQGEAKLLAAQAMVMQQPYGKGTKQKKFIEGSIERGFRRTIKPVFPSGKGGGKNEWHSPALQKIIKKNNSLALEAAFRAMGGRMTGAKVIAFNKEIHKSFRWKYPAPKEALRTYTLDVQQWKQRLKELKSRAGYIKAGWSKAYRELGGNKVPVWIARHLGYAKGFANTMALHTANPSVVFGAPSRFSKDANMSFQSAVNRRAKIMAKKLQQITNGYATAWKNGSLAVYKPKLPQEAEA